MDGNFALHRRLMLVKGLVEINEACCKGCGLCVAVCAKGALGLSEKLNKMGYHPAFLRPDSCVGCGNCATVCPDAAIKVLRFKGIKSNGDE